MMQYGMRANRALASLLRATHVQTPGGLEFSNSKFVGRGEDMADSQLE